MRRRLSILPDWQDPPGLGAAELDATWTRLTITVDEDFVTLVHADGSPRGYLNVSAYPHSIDLTSARGRDLGEIDSRKPWIAGFQAAAAVRDRMGVHAGRVDASLLAAAVTTPRRHRADLMDGYTQNVDGHSVVVIAGEGRSEELDRFLRARSLGLHLLRPDRTRFVMSDVRSPLQSAARSFAAELLAPAADVVAMRDEVGGSDASAFDIIARHFQVSTEVVERQYTNRITA